MNLQPVTIKKILYATDLSKSAVHAFAYAASLAEAYRASVTMLYVMAEFPGESFITNMIGGETWKGIKDRHYSEARDQLIGKRKDRVAMREVLEAFSNEIRIGEEGQAVEPDDILIKSGKPAEMIIETVEEGGFDLVVMGTHGQGVIADVLIGSTAKWVIKHCPVPVLVIRLP